jgi:hypothetical protein
LFNGIGEHGWRLVGFTVASSATDWKVIGKEEGSMFVSNQGLLESSEQNRKAKSRFHTQPGSLYAKQVDYDFRTNAFLPGQLVSNKVKEARKEILELKSANKLGKRPEWNSSSHIPVSLLERNKMRQLSAVSKKEIVISCYHIEFMQCFYLVSK